MQYSRRKRKRMSATTIAFIVIGAVLVYAGILAGVWLIGNKLEKPAVAEPVGSLDGRFTSDVLTMSYGGRSWTYREQDLTNLLVIGVDWDDLSESSARYAGQSDFLLLITLDRKNKTVSTLQLDRDTIADIRVFGPFGNYTGINQTQICLSHVYGKTQAESCENTVWAVKRLLGNIPIDGYLSLDMGAIPIINDTLGGVTVTLEEDFTALDPSMTKGTTLTLQGKQAEYYVRGRMSVGDGKNVSRMARQRDFIRKAEEMLVQGMNSDMDYIGRLFNALDGHMITNIERGTLINKAYESKNYRRLDTRTLAGSHEIGADGFMEFHADKDALNDLMTVTFFK